MKSTVQRRFALLAGLLLLSLLVLATGIQAAQAAVVAGDSGGSSTASFTTPAQPQGLTAAQLHHYGGGLQPVLNPRAAQSASSGTSSRTAWIAAGSAGAVVIVGFAAWALMRRRRQPGERPSAAYCAQHPEDALCTAA